MAKSVLVTGATGLLGRQVVKAFERASWDVVGTGLTRANPPSTLKVDLSNKEEVEKTLDDMKPQVVVHCKYGVIPRDIIAALKSALPVPQHTEYDLTCRIVGAAQRFPDKCDSDPVAARALNVEATQNLSKATNTRSILLIYISTDYIFPGKPGDAPYEAGASPQPPNFYGQTKLDGEKATLAETEKSGLGIVLRVPLLYGEATDPKESAVNVLMDAVWKAQEPNASISVDDWAIRYPTNTEDVARVVKDTAAKFVETSDKMGFPKILQFSSEDKYTKYQMCELFAEIMGLPLGGLKANKEGNDPNASVQRPYDTHLSTKTLQDLGIDVHTQDFTAWWRWQVKALRK